MERQSTFANIGYSVEGASTTAQVLKMAHLDYTVEEVADCFEFGGQLFNDNSIKKLVRMGDNGQPIVMGNVGPKYSVIQNSEAFGFLDDIKGDITFKKGGETLGGMQYIIASMDEVKILGDSFIPYIIARSSFNGKYTVSACINTLRIVCQNQVLKALKTATNTITISHTKYGKERLEESRQLIVAVADYMTELKAEAERLATIKISEANTTKLIEMLFPITETMSAQAKTTATARRLAFDKALHEEDNLNFKGSLWGIVNAATDYNTHYIGERMTAKKADNHFVSATFDSKFLDSVLAKAMALVG